MFNFSFCVGIPFVNLFKNVYCKSGQLTKHKAYEIEVLRTNNIVAAQVSITTGRDHAGTSVSIDLFTWHTSFSLYDTPHWDYEKDKWALYEWH